MSQMKNLHIEQMNLQCNAHDKFVQQINESGLPLWMSDEYDNFNALLLEQEEEEENQNLENSGPQELPDECYDQQEDIDHLSKDM